MCPFLEVNTNARIESFLSHLLRSCGRVWTQLLAVSNRESQYPRSHVVRVLLCLSTLGGQKVKKNQKVPIFFPAKKNKLDFSSRGQRHVGRFGGTKNVVLRKNKNFMTLEVHEPQLPPDSQTKISNLWYCHLRRLQRAR